MFSDKAANDIGSPAAFLRARDHTIRDDRCDDTPIGEPKIVSLINLWRERDSRYTPTGCLLSHPIHCHAPHRGLSIYRGSARNKYVGPLTSTLGCASGHKPYSEINQNQPQLLSTGFVRHCVGLARTAASVSSASLLRSGRPKDPAYSDPESPDDTWHEEAVNLENESTDHELQHD